MRQYFPKNSDFSNINDKKIQTTMDKLNNRHRKCLGMKAKNQVFFGSYLPVALVLTS